ncbi:MAG: class I SAM-dependent methyltransferase [Candidatus Magasanikbacteria bacterium]|nr:class I SAM-dependent methyltransferase [Candidatus Magasanikbacteria bacterium]
MADDLEQPIISPCPVCGSGRSKFFVVKNNCRIYRCQDCAARFVFPWPEPDWSGLYGEQYFAGGRHGFGYSDYDADKAAMRGTFLQYLDRLERLLPARGRLLDVGAATGYFVKLAGERGWQGSGVEPSDYAAGRGRAQGLDVQTGTLDTVTGAENYFDVITLWDVIEHLPNPQAALERVLVLLKPGGILAINTPDAGSWYALLLGRFWHQLVPPEHLVYFNPRNLSALLSALGFAVLPAEKIGKRFTVAYLLATIARWQPYWPWPSLARRAQQSAWGRRSLSLNLRDNFFLLARKK